MDGSNQRTIFDNEKTESVDLIKKLFNFYKTAFTGKLRPKNAQK